VQDLGLHDLRHEAISRFFEMGLSVPEVALISGHKDVKMLFRYTHLRPNDVAEKMHRIERNNPPEISSIENQQETTLKTEPVDTCAASK
jgi:integrase